MSDQHISVTMRDAQRGHAQLLEVWAWCKAMLMAGNPVSLKATRKTRSTEQNALMWSLLTDLSRQVDWPVDGRMVKLEPDEWKDILSAGLAKHQRVAQGIEGGFVMLGQRTSRMTVAQMGELITLGHAFGDQHGVRWSRTSLGRDVPEEAFA